MRIRYYEINGKSLWEDWGKFTEADVHHEYTIALKTPPYRSQNIEETVRFNIADSELLELTDILQKRLKFIFSLTDLVMMQLVRLSNFAINPSII